MKKLRLLALGLLSVSVMFLTSCEDDEEPTLGPSLTMQLNGNTTKDVTVSSNENLEFTWVARNGESKLETFSVSLSGANVINPLPTSAQGNDFPYDVRNADNENYVDTLSFNSGSNSGNTTYSFRVVDRDGNEEEVSFNVSLATPMNNEVQGAFFHISGTEEGAYDLVSDAQKALADPSAEKDMVNTDQAGATFTGSWEAGAGNNTTFVKSNSFDYDNATVDAAETAFAAGTATASVSDPVDGDIYIAQLRGGNNYAVIKITSVDPTDATCVCGNLGKIEFDYKKQ